MRLVTIIVNVLDGMGMFAMLAFIILVCLERMPSPPKGYLVRKLGLPVWAMVFIALWVIFIGLALGCAVIIWSYILTLGRFFDANSLLDPFDPALSVIDILLGVFCLDLVLHAGPTDRFKRWFAGVRNKVKWKMHLPVPAPIPQ